jgi:hypothetical protein
MAGLFDEDIFDWQIFDTDAVGVAIPEPEDPRGIPLNAYKQFKFIDSNGDPYYFRPQERYMLLDGD